MDNSTTPTNPTDGQAPMPSADGGMGAPAPVAGGDATPAPVPETPPTPVMKAT